MEAENFTILCVDDEPSILNALNRLLRKEKYKLLFANSGQEGLEILKENQVQMVISDQRMPGMSGTDFLSIVKDTYSDVVRVILTGYSDIDSITESINKGNIYKFFLKPWNDLELKSEIRQILDQQALMKTNQKLNHAMLEKNDQIKDIEEKLELLVNTRTHGLEIKNHMLELSHAILDELPICVVGIDIEGVIAIANKAALKTFKRQGLEIGRPFGEFFSENMVNQVRGVFQKGETVRIALQDMDGPEKEAAVIPLSGSFKGKGVIMTLNNDGS
jgi:response regulator RpfG family c-di-GMP phosphodiesterase